MVYKAAADVVRTLNVERAALGASAADQTREYGAPDPVFTGTLTGVVAGDNITASFSASDVPTSLPGTYPIVVSLNDPGGRLGNYTVTTHDGVLTIVAAKCDANGDGSVTSADLLIIRNASGQTVSGPHDPRDGNSDGTINLLDVRYCQLRQAR